MKVKHAVIGAGISGLSLAWHLQKRHGPSSVVLYEASSRPGGWIRTIEHEGFLFELGPRSCRTHGSGIATLELVEALGLQDEVIGASPAAKRRYLYTEGKLQPLPTSLWKCFTSPLMQGVGHALWNDLRTPRGQFEDETIAAFFDRRFGPAFAERFVDPLVAGIYAGDIHRLSMRACFPEWHRMEQTHRSLLWGMLRKQRISKPSSPFMARMLKEPIFTFRKGMETLVHALAEALKGQMRLETPVVRLGLSPEGVHIETTVGTDIAQKVYLAVPAGVSAALMRPHDPSLSEAMEAIPYSTVGIVNMGWKGNVLPLEGFGYLIPSKEKEDVLGMVWDSSAFPEQDVGCMQTRITAMVRGTAAGDLKEIAFRALTKHLGVSCPPDAIHISTAKDAIPQYEKGYLALKSYVENRIAALSDHRLHLAGTAWTGVAVNECIASAQKMT